MNLIYEAAKEVCDFMHKQGWKFCMIGGLAVQRWGEPRLTQDADFTLLTGFGNEESHIDTLLGQFIPRYDDARSFALINRVLLLYAANGIPVDISLGALPYEEEVVKHATCFDFDDTYSLPTCSADDLFVMKMFASRDRDIKDAKGIVVRQGATLKKKYIISRLKDLCDAVDRPEILAAAKYILEDKSWRK